METYSVLIVEDEARTRQRLAGAIETTPFVDAVSVTAPMLLYPSDPQGTSVRLWLPLREAA